VSCSTELIDTVQNISQSFVLRAQESKSGELFPSLIHQVWLGGKPFPETFQRSQKSFIEQNPDFYYALWRDKDVDCLLARFFPVLVPVWAKLPRTILRADLLRYLIIYTFGGFYSDTDTLCLRPIREWPMVAGARGMVGLEAEFSHITNWKDMIVSRQIQIALWTMASSPFHPLYAMAIQGIFTNGTRMSRDEIGGTDVMEMTGPGYFTDVVLRYMQGFGFGFANLSGMTRPTRFGDLLVQPLHVFRWEDRGPEREGCIRHLFGQSWRK
jgi:alpha 1,6-mannosyltransferase